MPLNGHAWADAFASVLHDVYTNKKQRETELVFSMIHTVALSYLHHMFQKYDEATESNAELKTSLHSHSLITTCDKRHDHADVSPRASGL